LEEVHEEEEREEDGREDGEGEGGRVPVDDDVRVVGPKGVGWRPVGVDVAEVAAWDNVSGGSVVLMRLTYVRGPFWWWDLRCDGWTADHMRLNQKVSCMTQKLAVQNNRQRKYQLTERGECLNVLTSDI
jgi:hypothetical protein